MFTPFVSVEQFYFVVGLVMFLIAHVCYIVAFAKNASQKKFTTSLQFKIAIALPFIILSGSVFFILKSSLGALLIPVTIYISVITAMGIFAALRYKKVSPVSFNFILIGAIFFMLSDTLLAFNKFMNPLPLAGFLIMSTYIAAQYLITEGSIEQLKN